jgi:hypothetical protein
MGGILGGALSGYSEEAANLKGSGKQGLLRRKKKQLPLTPPSSGNTTRLTPLAEPSSYRKGGRVKKGGWAKVHAGEKVISKKRGRRSGKRR